MKLIKIKSKDRFISKKAKLLKMASEQSVGLMFKKKGEVLMELASESKAMSSIHTFFCRPLIVAWLDKDMKVVDTLRTKPFWFYAPKKPAKYIFETTDSKKKIKIGEKWKIV
jgi:uncharacterized membrane protein (UPF0127 family)